MEDLEYCTRCGKRITDFTKELELFYEHVKYDGYDERDYPDYGYCGECAIEEFDENN